MPKLLTKKDQPTKTLTTADWDKMYKEDHQIVKGIFQNHEVPGGDVKFPFRKWKQDDIEMYYFADGEVYEVPKMVAKHINNTCSYPIHNYLLDQDGKPVLRSPQDGRAVTETTRRKKRYSFLSTDLM